MDKAEARELVLRVLGASLASAPGAVLYTGLDAVRPGPAYLMGLNPGGDPETIPQPILDCWPERERYSEYVHSCWNRHATGERCTHFDDSGAVKPEHRVKHQRNVLILMAKLGTEPESIVSANAVFARSTSVGRLQDETGLDLDSWWKACWPVHLALLSIVRPRVIVSLGRGLAGSAFALLRNACGGPPVDVVGEPGRNGGRAIDGEFALPDGTQLRARVVGVPHPSWYPPGPKLLEELQRIADASVD